jgi:methionine-rich copper-binding protein CopC
MLTFMPSTFVLSRRALPVLIALLILLVGQPHLTGAHADLVTSNPAAGGTISALPPKLTLTFAEEVKPDSPVVEVTGPDGQRVDAGDAAVDLTDATRKTVTVSLYAGGPGAYAVHWETVSNTDGHPLSGDFTFTVSVAAASSPTAATALASPTAFTTEDPTNGNPLSPQSDFDSRALGISVGAGLIAMAAIVGFWFAIRPRNPQFGPRSGRNRE